MNDTVVLGSVPVCVNDIVYCIPTSYGGMVSYRYSTLPTERIMAVTEFLCGFVRTQHGRDKGWNLPIYRHIYIYIVYIFVVIYDHECIHSYISKPSRNRLQGNRVLVKRDLCVYRYLCAPHAHDMSPFEKFDFHNNLEKYLTNSNWWQNWNRIVRSVRNFACILCLNGAKYMPFQILSIFVV